MGGEEDLGVRRGDDVADVGRGEERVREALVVGRVQLARVVDGAGRAPWVSRFASVQKPLAPTFAGDRGLGASRPASRRRTATRAPSPAKRTALTSPRTTVVLHSGKALVTEEPVIANTCVHVVAGVDRAPHLAAAADREADWAGRLELDVGERHAAGRLHLGEATRRPGA